MLRQLSIQNLAIVDDLNIDFSEHFNVISGETGAGKSIIIGALNLILGQRASSDMIRYGKKMATIQALFYLKDTTSKILSDVLQMSIDDEIILYRCIQDSGRSICKINNQMVSVATLSLVAFYLVDIHSQHESQYLLNSKYHLQLLDSYIERQYPNFLLSYQESYTDYLKQIKQLEEYQTRQNQITDMEYLQYQIEELSTFSYTVEEVDCLFEEYKALANIEKNAELIHSILEKFNGSEQILSLLHQVKKQMLQLDASSQIDNFYQRLDSAHIELEDIYDSFKDLFDYSNFDENRYHYLEKEIANIQRLRRKFHRDDLLKLKMEFQEMYDDAIHFEENIEILKKEIENKKQICLKKAEELSQLRTQQKKLLEKEILKQLEDLYLEDCQFSIQLEETELKKDGKESCEFYLSTNRGMPLRPLIKVASGGEISRIMLGLKAAFAKLNPLDLYVFDEIDTGVSGKVATAMGKKMAEIAKTSQVISITHLAQVVSCAQHHFYIEKIKESDCTKTLLHELDENGKIREIARLLSGNQITENSILLAKELLDSK